MTTLSCDHCSGTISKPMYSCTSISLLLEGELPSFWNCALCLCVLYMDGRWSTWVVRVGAPSKIFKSHSQLSRLDMWTICLSFCLICVGLLLCFFIYIYIYISKLLMLLQNDVYFSKPMRLLHNYMGTFLSHWGCSPNIQLSCCGCEFYSV